MAANGDACFDKRENGGTVVGFALVDIVFDHGKSSCQSSTVFLCIEGRFFQVVKQPLLWIVRSSLLLALGHVCQVLP